MAVDGRTHAALRHAAKRGVRNKGEMIKRVFQSRFIGLIFALLSVYSITGFAMTNAEEQQAVRAFTLTPSYLERWIAGREEAIAKGISIGTFELRDPTAQGDAHTPERRYNYIENCFSMTGLLGSSSFFSLSRYCKASITPILTTLVASLVSLYTALSCRKPYHDKKPQI